MSTASAYLKLFPFLSWLQTYSIKTLKLDINAGLSGAIIVLPQGVAFAAIAGLPPEYGLYSAIVPTIVAALFGSSRHLISGPTTAVSLVIYGNLSQLYTPLSSEYITAVFSLTLLTGIIQLLFGLMKLGTLINFVSHSVVVGFTSGTAILIGFSQLGNFTGIAFPSGSAFYEKLPHLINHINQISTPALTIGFVAMLISVFIQKYVPKLPHMLSALICGGIVAYILGGADAGIKLLGALPSHLPQFVIPNLSMTTVEQLGTSALAIAILGLTEALSIARSIAMQSKQHINTNQEFTGQGLCNIAGSFFSCYAASGSFTRTGVNYTAGARTPAAAVFAACFLAGILLLIAPVTAYLPIPAMAGVLMVVAFRLIDFHHIKGIMKTSRQEFGVMLVTLLSTLFLHLEFAIYVGVILSLLLYINKTSHPELASITLQRDEAGISSFVEVTSEKVLECPQIKIVRLRGEIFFGATNNIIESLHKEIDECPTQTKLLVILKAVTFIDIAGCEMFSSEREAFREKGCEMYLSSLNPEVRGMLNRAGVLQQFGNDHIFANKRVAIKKLAASVNTEKCTTCKARIFDECAGNTLALNLQ
ncbi:SulP family inorganic anion transporter [Halodesulfovibrio marinisediminis]|uniref:Sulfate permease, SulP family n=1 Tax=Halodesulfovibrio marinisediminis DSM 17456 TaxID=1121457 RepID=A0A1N6FUT6_9BACT|nr:SulP family inorganic anion transporter [Halodesulfovibrio marinisediminis]SIN99045.1 sulfate permease, SulP family [Halodesulfovibrio marinisediminis DSM 17456]